MKVKFFLVLTILLLSVLTGCNNESSEEVNDFPDSPSFSTKEAALNDFLQDNPRNDDTELIKTTDGDEILIVRYGNHQYSPYGIKNDNGTYSIVKLAAWVSLHNTKGVRSEITTPSGNELTYSLVKEKGLGNITNTDITSHDHVFIFSDEIKFTLNKGHTSDESGSITPANFIDSTEQMVLSDSTS